MVNRKSEVGPFHYLVMDNANANRKWLTSQNNKAASKAGASRNDLLKQAQDSYASASKSGGSNYASVTSYLASATDAAKTAPSTPGLSLN